MLTNNTTQQNMVCWLGCGNLKQGHFSWFPNVSFLIVNEAKKLCPDFHYARVSPQGYGNLGIQKRWVLSDNLTKLQRENARIGFLVKIVIFLNIRSILYLIQYSFLND